MMIMRAASAWRPGGVLRFQRCRRGASMIRILRSRVFIAIAASIVTAVAVGGVAWSIQDPVDSGGAIHACYNPTTGAVKLDVVGSCPATGAKTPITWSAQGPKGDKGDGLHARGAWSSTDAYPAGSIVTTADDTSWIAVSDNTGSAPAVGNPDWQQLAPQGPQGPAGPPGPAASVSGRIIEFSDFAPGGPGPNSVLQPGAQYTTQQSQDTSDCATLSAYFSQQGTAKLEFITTRASDDLGPAFSSIGTLQSSSGPSLALFTDNAAPGPATRIRITNVSTTTILILNTLWLYCVPRVG